MWMTNNLKLLWAIFIKKSNGNSHCSFVIRGNSVGKRNVYCVIILIMNVVFLTLDMCLALQIHDHRYVY